VCQLGYHNWDYRNWDTLVTLTGWAIAASCSDWASGCQVGVKIPAQKPIKSSPTSCVLLINYNTHTSPTGWEHRRTGNPATEVLSFHGHCNQVTETGKAIWECSTIWQIWLNDQQLPDQNMMSMWNFVEIWLAVLTLWLVHSALLQDYWKMTDNPRVYGELFSVII